MDPLAEKYYSISPYTYCAGNPVNAIDPNGLELIKVIVPANKNGSRTKSVLVDSKVAAQMFNFAWDMNAKYGLTFTNAFRSKELQANMRYDYYHGNKGNYVALPAQISAHSSGFAIDMNVSILGLNKYNYNLGKNRLLMSELTNVAKEFGLSYGGTSFASPDVVHFYFNETDYGYESRTDAIAVNDEYLKENGDNIPTYNNESSQNIQNDVIDDNDPDKIHLNAFDYQTYFMNLEDKNKALMKNYQYQIDAAFGKK